MKASPLKGLIAIGAASSTTAAILFRLWSAPTHLDKNDASSRRTEDLSDFEKLSYVEKCRYILDRNGDISTLKILPVDIEFGVIDSLLSRFGSKSYPRSLKILPNTDDNDHGADESDYNEIYNGVVRLKESRKLMRSLVTEAGEVTDLGCTELCQKGLIELLFNLTNAYREMKDVKTDSLKVLANVSRNYECSKIIADSGWIYLLASMIYKPVHQEEEIFAHKTLINLLHSFDAEQYSLGSSIYELYRPTYSQKPLIDIVLIHGLRGSIFRTWRQRDQKIKHGETTQKQTLFWPKDWLPEDIDQPIRILALDYTSTLFNRKRNRSEPIKKRSERLMLEMISAGIGERPIVFICHSMGGLLVKYLMENDKILNSTVGVLFITTPHFGVPLASSYPLSVLRPSDDIKFLQIGNPDILELHGAFSRIVPKIPVIYSILETDKTSIYGRKNMVVPHESAILGEGKVYHVKTHHHDACKPGNRDSEIYQIVLNFLNDSIKYVKENRRKYLIEKPLK